MKTLALTSSLIALLVDPAPAAPSQAPVIASSDNWDDATNSSGLPTERARGWDFPEGTDDDPGFRVVLAATRR